MASSLTPASLLPRTSTTSPTNVSVSSLPQSQTSRSFTLNPTSTTRGSSVCGCSMRSLLILMR